MLRYTRSRKICDFMRRVLIASLGIVDKERNKIFKIGRGK